MCLSGFPSHVLIIAALRWEVKGSLHTEIMIHKAQDCELHIAVHFFGCKF